MQNLLNVPLSQRSLHDLGSQKMFSLSPYSYANVDQTIFSQKWNSGRNIVISSLIYSINTTTAIYTHNSPAVIHCF